jgi:hypothetical protein
MQAILKCFAGTDRCIESLYAGPPKCGATEFETWLPTTLPAPFRDCKDYRWKFSELYERSWQLLTAHLEFLLQWLKCFEFSMVPLD